MSESGKREKQGVVRQAAETALDVAIGGTALAAEKAVETLDKVVSRKPVSGTDARPYEERSREELYELAAERGIDGRSAMRKQQLIAALRAER